VEDKETKWLCFTCVKDTEKTKVFDVKAKEGNSLLGRIGWYPSWRQYTFIPTIGVMTCLTDITEFLKELAEERKQKNGN
jgi:hypothetical protein